MTFQSPPPKKPSFLRRLSLSSQPQPVIHVANVTTATGFPAVGTKNTLQSTSGPSKKNLLAGPAYEAIPSRPAPSAFRGVEQATSVNKEIEDRSRLKASAIPPQPAAALASVGGRPPVPANNVTTTALSASASHAAIAPTYTASSSPPLSAAPAGTRRHPIHPALASPPNSPPRLQEGGSPYMTNGLASPPRMTYSKPSALEPGWLADQAVATNGHRPSEQQDRKASSASSPSSGPRSGRQALGPHSIPLPPHNSYEIIASSSTVTPRASRSPPFRAASSPPGINLSQATTPRPNPKQALLAGQAHSPPRAQAGMPPSMISGQSADADGPNDLQSTEAVGTPARIRPQQALQGSLASARRTRSSTGNAKPLGSAPSPGRPHHQDPVRPHHQDPVRPNLQDSDATPMESTTRPSAKPRQTSSYFPSSMPKSPVPGHGSAGLSEAGAYAKSIATALAMGQSDSPVRRTSASAPPVPVTDRRVSRPLPEPPALVKVSADPSQTSPPPVARSTVHAIASSRTTGGRNSAQSAELPFEPGDSRNRSPDRYNHPSIPKISSEKKQEQSDAPNIDQEQVNFERMIRPGDRRMPSSRPGNNDNSRSPSALGTTALPSLGPRLQLDTINPVEQGVTNAKSRRAIETSSKPFVANSSAATPVTRNPPPRVSSASSHNQHPASSSLSSAALPSSGRLVTHLKDIDPNKKPLGGSQQAQDLAALSPKASYAPSAPRAIASLPLLLANQQIQECLLPFLSINSFLSLTGASKVVRKLFTGETVGRWVTREWDLQLDRERGRTWPNLTVWEGFLESLLHDPSTYSTYSQQWYNLLQHLSLSHTLIVLHLRNMPALAFPISAPLPFEDENGTSAPQLPFSASGASLSSINLPRSRMSSTAGSDAGSTAPTNKMPRHERLMEISMPEPLAAQPRENAASAMQLNSSRKTGRRGSINSIASAASLSFGRKRSNSTATGTEIRADMVMNVTGPAAQWAAPTMSGKAALPPVSYPNAKRYGFTRHGDPLSVSGRTRTSSESGRPGSIFSIQSSSSISPHQRLGSSFGGRLSFIVDRQAPPVPGLPVGMTSPSPIAGKHRASVSGSDAGRSTRLSEYGGSSPVPGRRGSPYQSRRDLLTLTMKVEPAFENPPPYIPGRAPILRVFVPLSERLRQWPSAEGAKLAIKELDKCGATRRLKLGDLVINTAIQQPRTTEHVLLFVPHVKHLLVPFDYTHCSTGHLPSYVDAFSIAPSYYYPFLPSPQIIYLDLAPFAERAMKSVRLAHDRRDVTVSSGARLTAKRYLHVAGFEVRPGDNVSPEWHGMVSLEAEGTAEGKTDIQNRLGGGAGSRAIMGPWEVVREKSMMGTIWLRLVRESPLRS